MIPIYYFHGLESSPSGFRANYLREHFPHIRVPALSRDPYERLDFLLKTIEEPMMVVGSSLGGLSALMLAREKPHLVQGMVLLAPAVGFFDPAYRTPEILALVESLVVPQGIPTHVIFGWRDEVIPPASIEAMIARSPEPTSIMVTRLDDEHRLHSQAALDAMISATQDIAQRLNG